MILPPYTVKRVKDSDGDIMYIIETEGKRPRVIQKIHDRGYTLTEHKPVQHSRLRDAIFEAVTK